MLKLSMLSTDCSHSIIPESQPFSDLALAAEPRFNFSLSLFEIGLRLGSQ